MTNPEPTITQEQRDDAKLQALLSDSPWLSERGLTSFEHEQQGALGVIQAMLMLLMVGKSIDLEAVLSVGEAITKIKPTDVYPEPPKEAF